MTGRLTGRDFDAPPDKATRKQRLAAQTFQRDARLEEAVRMRREEPARYAQLPAGVKLQIGYYETAKAAAETEAEREAAA